MTSWARSDDERTSRSPFAWLGEAPGLKFHLVIAVPALFYLWSRSFPGSALIPWFIGCGGIALAALVWLVRAIRLAAKGKGDGRRRRSLRWFLVAPTAGVLVVALVRADVPLRARWALAKDDFAKQLPAALERDDYRDIRPHRLGTYNIVSIDRNHDAVIFTEASGAFSNDAGFAFLPNGPHPALENGSFEAPEFVHLGGHWYAWTASW